MIKDLKGQNILSFNLNKKSNLTDFIIICTGTSNQHVIAIAQEILKKIYKMGSKPYGFEGLNTGTWAVIDLNDVIVHIMLKETRQLYELEKIWNFIQ